MSQARLHVSDSQGRRVVVLDRPQFLIGRRTAADLQIVSTDVSREHAEIVQEEGRYVLRDRGSRYGTFVNGEKIKRARHELAHHLAEKILYGRHELTRPALPQDDPSLEIIPPHERHRKL